MYNRVFISYSTDDAQITAQIRDGLEAAGISCWMAPRDIAPGMDYGEQIIRAIERCALLVLVLSESANVSQYVRNEVERAIAKSKTVIAARVQPVQPSRSLEFFISNVQWIDAWQVSTDDLVAVLASAIRHCLADKSTSDGGTGADIEPATPLPPQNLPRELTPFIGREAELAALDALMVDPDVHLVTLVGPGGIGKTRLALAAAYRQLSYLPARSASSESPSIFPNGIFLVSLVSATTVESAISIIAEAVSLAFQDGKPPRVQVLEYLQNKRLLLLLDNLEQLLEEPGSPTAGQSITQLIEDILATAPLVKIIATSRERLRVSWERVITVTGLPVATAGEQSEPDSAATALFLMHAKRVWPAHADFTATDMDEIAAICRLVEGMPLAIELAAAQIRLYSLREMAASISQSLDALETRSRDLNWRHQSIRAVFDVSWDSLTADEQLILAQLAIFAGGFTRRAAEEIVQAKPHHLSALLDKSLVADGVEGRFGLHTLLKQFAAQKLAEIPAQRTKAQQRHYDYYRQMLGQAVSDWTDGYDPTTLDILNPDAENFRVAWNWVLDQADWTEADVYIGNLWQFFNVRRRLPEAIELLNQALQVSQGAIPPPAPIYRARWTRLLGDSYLSMSQMGRANEHFRQALSILDTHLPDGNLRLVVGILQQVLIQTLHRMWPAYFVGRQQQKQDVLQECSYAYEKLAYWATVEQKAFLSIHCAFRSLNLAEAAGLVGLMARGYANIGVVGGMVPLHAVAQSYLARADLLALEEDAPATQVRIALNGCVYSCGIGEWDKAIAYCQLGTRTAVKLGNHFDKETIWVVELNVALFQGDLQRSLGVARRLRASSQRRGDIGFEAAALYWEALIGLRQNEVNTVVALLEESVATPVEAMNQFDYVIIHATLAQAYLRQDRIELARQEADLAMALIVEAGRPTFGVVQHAYSGVAAVYLAIWEANPTGTDEMLPLQARRACRNLNSLARIFPIGKPSAYRRQGLYEWLMGKPKKAHKAWEFSLASARALRMPVDEGLAHYEVARHLPAENENRQLHFNSAIRIFTELGADYDLARANAAMRGGS